MDREPGIGGRGELIAVCLLLVLLVTDDGDDVRADLVRLQGERPSLKDNLAKPTNSQTVVRRIADRESIAISFRSFGSVRSQRKPIDDFTLPRARVCVCAVTAIPERRPTDTFFTTRLPGFFDSRKIPQSRSPSKVYQGTRGDLNERTGRKMYSPRTTFAEYLRGEQTKYPELKLEDIEKLKDSLADDPRIPPISGH